MNFRLPLKSLLEFDSKVFTSHLQKLKKAHEIELKWVKKAAKDKAFQMLRRAYQNTKDILEKEMKILMEEFSDIKLQLVDSEK